MLQDILYHVLKQEKRAYEVMLLYDQRNSTWTEIAKGFEISVGRVKQIYNQIKIKQIHFYINHLAAVLGHINTLQIRKVFDTAFDCYQELAYACAYLEKKYKTILDEYRAGEPGMPVQFVQSLPPLRSKLSKRTIARVIEMREVEKASYIKIGEALNMTKAKARHTYEWFYHEQVLDRIKALQKKAESREEKDAVWEYYFRQYKTSKKRYDNLVESGKD